jgi:hypothetical protein
MATAFVELVASKIGTRDLTVPKKILVDLDKVRVITKSGTGAQSQVNRNDGSASYEVYENVMQIQLLQDPSSTNVFFQDKKTGLTAGTTQTQVGGLALTKYLNEISTCANAGDTVVLPAAATNKIVVVINNGANSAKVFPASGGKIDGGSLNASVNLASGSRAHYWSPDGTNWTSITY